MAVTPTLQSFSPSAGTRSQVNSGSGAVYDKSQTFTPGIGGNMFNAQGAYIGPKVIPPAGYSVGQDGKIVSNYQPIPGTQRILSSWGMTTGKTVGGLPGGGTKSFPIAGGSTSSSYPGMTSSMNSLFGFGNPLQQGPVSYSDKKTLSNVQERLDFNRDLAALFGVNYSGMYGLNGQQEPVKRGNFSISRNVTTDGGKKKSWTDQLLDMTSRVQMPTGGPTGPQSVREMLGLQAEHKAGYTRLPNPASLDPNDWRLKVGPGYWGRPNTMMYNFDGSNTVSVKPHGAGELRGAPIRQY